MSQARADAWVRLARRIAVLVERESGIVTPEHQLEALLQKASGLVPDGLTLEAYLGELALDAGEQARFIEGICTHETRFFRHPEHFAVLERSWLPERLADTQRRRVRAWSVACSSGEEPYSLAMWLSDHFPRREGWTPEVLGTDFSRRVLDRAQGATWPLSRQGEISAERLERYMLRGRGQQTGLMRANTELRELVRFQQLNLVQQPYAIGEDFDLVFLRNVLIYFSTDTRRQVLRAVVSLMAHSAVLVTGPSEGVSYLGEPRLRSIAPHIYVYVG